LFDGASSFDFGYRLEIANQLTRNADLLYTHTHKYIYTPTNTYTRTHTRMLRERKVHCWNVAYLQADS